jgi:KipI family sensor histidine kinase inhibitor
MALADPAAFRFLDAGEGGLVVELGDEISEAVNARVVALADALGALALPGVQEIVPTYRSLLVLFDPLELPRATLREKIAALWPPSHAAGRRHARWRVPVRYGGEHGVDLEAVAAQHGLTADEVVALHAGADYRVYMLGFMPGFVYLGGLPARLHTGRRHDPRMRTPVRSISIGGIQAGISPPIEVPSGWHLLGQTPVRSYDPRRAERPFLFEAGDSVCFEPVTEAEYDEMCAAAEAGDVVAVREDAGG